MLPSQAYHSLGGMVRPDGSNEVTAEQIMNDHADVRATWGRTALRCHCAIYPVTDNADWLESGVIGEDTLNAEGFMAEATK